MITFSDYYISNLQCYIGFAGDGMICGYDKDSDGYPDEHLDCKDKFCVKVV